jgi:N-acetyl-anhydromuramyl-L-alanine amidase AmpD
VTPQDPYNFETCWQLMRDLNYPPEQRLYGLYHEKDRAWASAHIMIDREGVPYRLVPLDIVAWHAGESEWNGVTNLNTCSIGIENIGMHGQPYTDAQYRTNARICRALLDQYGLSHEAIVGHEQIALPRGRKDDPGPSFDWGLLRQYIDEAA